METGNLSQQYCLNDRLMALTKDYFLYWHETAIGTEELGGPT